jgi:hypothetical protein
MSEIRTSSCLKETKTFKVIRCHYCTSMKAQIVILWAVTQWSSVSWSQPFGGKFCFHYYCWCEWKESVIQLHRRNDRDDVHPEPRRNETEWGLSGPREVVTCNSEKQPFCVRTETNLRHCHIADGLSEPRTRERRQTEVSLFRLREKTVSHSFVSAFLLQLLPRIGLISLPFSSFRMIIVIILPMSWLQSYSCQSDPEDVYSMFPEMVVFTFKTKRCHNPKYHNSDTVAATIILKYMKFSLCPIC